MHHAVRRDIEIGHIDSPRKETVDVVTYKAAGIKVRVLLQKLSQLGVDIICSFFWPNHAFCIAERIDQIDDRIYRNRKYVKVIPSVNAEINKSQTLVTYNRFVSEDDKRLLRDILSCIGNVIELPENEMGMGSELVSCMPGFIASIFDVICQSAIKHTSIPQEQVIKMVLDTLSSTGELMLRKDMSFEDVVKRVATKGGITEVGSRVIYDGFLDIADEMFEKTLAKRRETAAIVKTYCD